jgi:hypothetical protein
VDLRLPCVTSLWTERQQSGVWCGMAWCGDLLVGSSFRENRAPVQTSLLCCSYPTAAVVFFDPVNRAVRGRYALGDSSIGVFANSTLVLASSHNRMGAFDFTGQRLARLPRLFQPHIDQLENVNACFVGTDEID